MTKLRRPESIEDAALEALRVLGADVAGRVAGVSAGAARKWTDADAPGRPTLHQAVLVDAACRQRGARAPFEAAYRHELARLGASEAPAGDVLAEALDVPMACGQLIGAVRDALDGAGPGAADVTPGERHAILVAIREARRQIDDLERAVLAAAPAV